METRRRAILWSIGMISLNSLAQKKGSRPPRPDLLQPDADLGVFSELFRFDPNHILFRGSEGMRPSERIHIAARGFPPKN